jgi:hypothetical protein
MNVTYTEKARQKSEDFALLQRATNWLQEDAGPSASHAIVEWDRIEDEKSHPHYMLRISDKLDAASASFDRDELTGGTLLRYRLSRVWGDLLQARSHRLLDDLMGGNGSEN